MTLIVPARFRFRFKLNRLPSAAWRRVAVYNIIESERRGARSCWTLEREKGEMKDNRRGTRWQSLADDDTAGAKSGAQKDAACI